MPLPRVVHIRPLFPIRATRVRESVVRSAGEVGYNLFGKFANEVLVRHSRCALPYRPDTRSVRCYDCNGVVDYFQDVVQLLHRVRVRYLPVPVCHSEMLPDFWQRQAENAIKPPLVPGCREAGGFVGLELNEVLPRLQRVELFPEDCAGRFRQFAGVRFRYEEGGGHLG